ncbi:MAG: AI-2E family transporter [Bacteroidales bacterium]|nr:AI-2E family transporter [Bacteroidales bacterium]
MSEPHINSATGEDAESAYLAAPAESPISSAEWNQPRRHWADTTTLRSVASVVIILAGSWYLLSQLDVVLRPLLLAVFLAYVWLPYYNRLRQRLPSAVAVALLAGVTTLVLTGLALAVYGSLSALALEEPLLKARALDLLRLGTETVNYYLPGALGGTDGRNSEEMAAEQITQSVMWLVNLAALGLLEALTAGLYLLFLLLESGRFPNRVRAAYPAEQAEQILHMFGRINSAIISYLKAKVLSSLVLAVPVGVVLSVCGVRFALLWVVLTFVCNFIPYIGSVIAYSFPVGFALLQLDIGIGSAIVAVALLACHIGSASVVEPMILGRAVGLSPLVILAALSVWGLLWGLPGMFLAVPLTVVVVIVLDHLEVTRPVARLLGGS